MTDSDIEIFTRRNGRLLLYIYIVAFVLFTPVTLSVVKTFFESNPPVVKYNDYDGCDKQNYPFCNLTDTYQFEKFIMIGLDGLSWEFINETRSLLSEHSHEYPLVTTFNFYTNELLKTYFGGAENLKLTPFTISGESLMSAYNRQYPKKIHLYGSVNTFGHAFKTYGPMYWNVTQQDDLQPLENHRPFSYWFAEANRSKFLQQLDLWNKNNVSVITWHDETDVLHHNQGRLTHYTNFSWSITAANYFAKDVVFLKDWIDEHPEYLLLIVSDHGHDTLEIHPDGRKTILGHGGFVYPNTGYFIFYNPKLTHESRILNVTDVLPTWVKYLKNVDIPANAVGMSRTFMPYLRDQLKIKQQSLMELWHLCRNGTTFCKGKAYSPELSEPSQYMKNNLLSFPHSTLKKGIYEMISFDAAKAFPQNISLTHLEQIANGKEEEEIPADVTITKAEAQTILANYNTFDKAAEDAYQILYDYVHVKHPVKYTVFQWIGSVESLVALVISASVHTLAFSQFLSKELKGYYVYMIMFFVADIYMLYHSYESLQYYKYPLTDKQSLRRFGRVFKKFEAPMRYYLPYGIDYPVNLRIFGISFLLFIIVHLLQICYRPVHNSISNDNTYSHMLLLTVYSVLLLIIANVYPTFNNLLTYYVDNAPSSIGEGFYTGHVTSSSLLSMIYIFVIEIFLPLILILYNHLMDKRKQKHDISHSTADSLERGEEESDDTVQLDPSDASQLKELEHEESNVSPSVATPSPSTLMGKIKTIRWSLLYRLLLLLEFFLLYIFAQPSSQKYFIDGYQPAGCLVCIIAIIQLVVSFRNYSKPTTATGEDAETVLPRPSAFKLPPSLSVTETLCSAFSSQTPGFMAMTILLLALLVQHPAQWIVFVLYLLIHKLIILPAIGIIFKTVCYLSITPTDMSMHSRIWNVLKIIESAFGLLLVRGLGIHILTGAFAGLYSMAGNLDFEVEPNRWRGVLTVTMHPVISVSIMSINKYGIGYFMAVDAAFLKRLSEEVLRKVMTHEKKEKTLTLHALAISFSLSYFAPIFIWAMKSASIAYYFKMIQDGAAITSSDETLLLTVILYLIFLATFISELLSLPSIKLFGRKKKRSTNLSSSSTETLND